MPVLKFALWHQGQKDRNKMGANIFMYIQYMCSFFLRLPFILHTVVLCIDKHKMTFITPIEVFSQINWLQSQKSWLSLQLLFHLFHITPQGIITALWGKIIYRNITENFGISCQLLVNTILTFYASTHDLLVS